MFKEPKPYKVRGTFMAFTPILCQDSQLATTSLASGHWGLACYVSTYTRKVLPSGASLYQLGMWKSSQKESQGRLLPFLAPTSSSSVLLPFFPCLSLQSIPIRLKVITLQHVTHLVILLVFPTGSKFIPITPLTLECGCGTGNVQRAPWRHLGNKPLGFSSRGKWLGEGKRASPGEQHV